MGSTLKQRRTDPHLVSLFANFFLSIISGFVSPPGSSEKNLSTIFAESDFFKAQAARIAKTEAIFRNESFGHPDNYDRCSLMSPMAQVWCKAFFGMVSKPQYSQRPKPGIFVQVINNLSLYLLLQWRRGILVEMMAVCLLASVCAFVKIFNLTWNRRALCAFYISVSISNLGMLGAALEDDVLPVRRALNSGMLMGSHEFARLFYSIIKSIVISHLFTYVYFTIVYLFYPVHATTPRTWCAHPFRISPVLHFAHLLTMEYNAARSLGLLIVVMTDHNIRHSLVVCIWCLMSLHCFSLFTPTRNQMVKDGFVFMGTYNIGSIVLFLCSFSYVRYFIEGMLLWDPEQGDVVGRQYALNYYGMLFFGVAFALFKIS